jgi:hypothetical protein
MSSARHESEVNQQEERPDLVISINNTYNHRGSWHINTLTTNDRYRRRQAEAMGVAFNFIYRSKDAVGLNQVNHHLYTLFQPKLRAVEPYHNVLKHVFYAGPLDQLETYIIKNPEILLKTFNINDMQGTLVELAVIGLDQTIKSNDGTVVGEGVKEKLLQLHEELEKQKKLQPGSHAIALEKANCASLHETAEEKAIRETNNVAALEQLFDAFVGNPNDTQEIKAGKITTAITTFKAFLKSLKQQMMTNGIMKTNQYHLNLIHLIASAFDVLGRRGGSLEGKWYGALGDRFCFEVIGGAIQSELPPRARQLIKQKLYSLFNENRQVIRDLDVNGALFKSFTSAFAKFSLGVSLFYDDFGAGRGGSVGGWLRAGVRRPSVYFYNLLQQFYQQPILTPRPNR